jgi:hypothetical protein
VNRENLKTRALGPEILNKPFLSMSLERLCKCCSIAVTGTPAPPTGRANHHNRFDVNRRQPILEIHTGAIRITDPAKVNIQVTEKHAVLLTCTCGWKLLVHASKKGAFCQFETPVSHMVCGSLPEAAFLPGLRRVPGSLKRLFVPGPDTELFVNQDDETELQVMFAGVVDPLVGSYSELGNQLLAICGTTRVG